MLATRTTLADPSAKYEDANIDLDAACVWGVHAHVYVGSGRRAACSPLASTQVFGAGIEAAEAHASVAHPQPRKSPPHVQY